MGQAALAIPPDLSPALRTALSRGWFAGGYDGAPAPVQRKDTPELLVLTRAENESGFYSVTWPQPGSNRVVATSTLRLRNEPYAMLTELCRGAVNRIRGAIFEYQMAGLTIPPTILAAALSITKQFGRLAVGDGPQTEAATDLLDAAFALADQTADILTEYRLGHRLSTDGPLPTKLGCRVSCPPNPKEAEAFEETFNAIRIVPDWKALEPNEAAFNWSSLDPLVDWAASAKIPISMGPLIDLTAGHFPDWLLHWVGDLPNLAAFFSDFLATLIARYKDRVRSWHVFAGFNHADTLGLVEDDRIRLAARLLEATQQVDAKAERTFALTQPWGDYLSSEDLTYSPLVFADTLMRAGFAVSAIELEMLTGATEHRGSQPRDALDSASLLDLFDHLGVPLEIALGSARPELLRPVVSHPSVRAVYWDGWSSTDPMLRVPDSALVADGRVDPAKLVPFQELRRNFLRSTRPSVTKFG